MHEIISIHIGQAGVQISNAAWELFCIEHGIMANGLLKDHLKDNDSLAFTTFFQEVPGGQYVPRAISLDLEPTVLDEVRTGAYRNLWHPDQLISGMEDAANNYARGHYTLGKTLIDPFIDSARKAADMCDMLQGFFIINSYGGGSGSGFSALAIERIGVEYTKRSKIQIGVVPATNTATAVVEPFNSLLSINSSTDNSEIVNMVDNEAVCNMCSSTLDLPRPTYNNINRVLAQVLSALTVSFRFESYLNADFCQLSTNLIPFPRIHYPVVNYAPIISTRRAEHEKISIGELTRSIFDDKSSMISVNLHNGKYMSCCLQYRGDVTPKQVNSAVFEIKRRTDIKFVEWCPTGFKLGINCQPPTAVPGSEIAQTNRSLLMLTNTTAVNQVWQGILRKFDVLFSKRSFVHWYVGEGMEEGEFNEARDEMNVLVSDYIEAAVSDEDDEEELPPAGVVPPQVLPSGNSQETRHTDANEGEGGEEPVPDYRAGEPQEEDKKSQEQAQRSQRSQEDKTQRSKSQRSKSQRSKSQRSKSQDDRTQKSQEGVLASKDTSRTAKSQSNREEEEDEIENEEADVEEDEEAEEYHIW